MSKLLVFIDLHKTSHDYTDNRTQIWYRTFKCVCACAKKHNKPISCYAGYTTRQTTSNCNCIATLLLKQARNCLVWQKKKTTIQSQGPKKEIMETSVLCRSCMWSTGEQAVSVQPSSNRCFLSSYLNSNQFTACDLFDNLPSVLFWTRWIISLWMEREKERKQRGWMTSSPALSLSLCLWGFLWFKKHPALISMYVNAKWLRSDGDV